MITLLGFSSWARAGDVPSTALLEFLGTASKLGQQWVDPMTLHDAPGVLSSDSDSLTSAPAENAAASNPARSAEVMSQPGTTTQEAGHAQ